MDNSIISISLAIESTKTVLPSNVIDKSNVKLQVQGGVIRFRFNTTVDINDGFVANIGDMIILESIIEVANFNAIAVSGTPILEIIAK